MIKKINFKENERVIKIVRCYPLTYLFPFLITLFLIASPFFFLFLLFSLKLIGVIIFSAVLLLGIIYGTREFVLWYFNAFIITNQRIIDIDQRGFFDRIVSEVPFEKIQDIFYRTKGIFQTLFHYGNLQIQTTNAIKFEFKNVYRPEKIQELIAFFVKQDQKSKFGLTSVREKDEKVTESDFEFIMGKIGSLNENQLMELDKKIKEEMKNKMIKIIQDTEL